MKLLVTKHKDFKNFSAGRHSGMMTTLAVLYQPGLYVATLNKKVQHDSA